jgi:4-methyl-5(b-hydroxyethyl)-thiazole monophosphate biosynthesis
MFEAFVVPGGLPGAKTLANSSDVKNTLREANKRDKLVCAVCAGISLLVTCILLSVAAFVLGLT